MPNDPNTYSLISQVLHLVASWRGGLSISVATASLSAAGIIPRFGPVRAVVLAARSRFLSPASNESVRSSQCAMLHNKVMQKQWGHQYVVVVGDKGVGKTTLIDAATTRTAGVVELTVASGTQEGVIVEQVLNRITNIHFRFHNPIANARRVLWWHRLLIRKSPLVIIHLSERTAGESFAQVTGAVRQLTDTYQLRVIIDASPNSLDPTALTTKRQDIIDVPPMTRDMVEALPQLQSLFEKLKEAQLADVVWEVLGGNPAEFELLASKIEANDIDVKKVTEIVERELQHRILDALTILTISKMENADLSKLIQLYEEAQTGFVTLLEAEAKGIKLSSPDKVFRRINQEGENILVPASNALKLVIEHKLTRAPSLQRLLQLVRPASKPSVLVSEPKRAQP